MATASPLGAMEGGGGEEGLGTTKKFLTAKFQIGSCKGPTNYSAQETVFHPDDVPATKKENKAFMKKWKRGGVGPGEKSQWNGSSYVDQFVFRRTRVNSEHDRPNMYQYNLRAEHLPPKNLEHIPKPHKFKIDVMSDERKKEIRDAKAADPVLAGKATNSEMPVNRKLLGKTSWNSSSYVEDHERLKRAQRTDGKSKRNSARVNRKLQTYIPPHKLPLPTAPPPPNPLDGAAVGEGDELQHGARGRGLAEPKEERVERGGERGPVRVEAAAELVEQGREGEDALPGAHCRRPRDDLRRLGRLGDAEPGRHEVRRGPPREAVAAVAAGRAAVREDGPEGFQSFAEELLLAALQGLHLLVVDVALAPQDDRAPSQVLDLVTVGGDLPSAVVEVAPLRRGARPALLLRRRPPVLLHVEDGLVEGVLVRELVLAVRGDAALLPPLGRLGARAEPRVQDRDVVPEGEARVAAAVRAPVLGGHVGGRAEVGLQDRRRRLRPRARGPRAGEP